MSVLNGVDNLSSVESILKAKRLGLITNPSGLSADFRPTIDILHEHYTLCRLYAPEHGVRGDKQAGDTVSDEIDEATGIPVVSMFGRDGRMDLDGIDAVVYDIQDVGLRFYTYIYILADAMKNCARAGVPLVVLDRPDPLGLSTVRGTVIDSRFDSGVGGYGLPSRYGLTPGEFARYCNDTFRIGCELYVAPCLGLTRDMTFPDLGQPWVQPSPNLPTYESALCYEGTVFIEGTNVSEGRGTTRPFEIIGAPWMDNGAVVVEMRKSGFEGVLFRTVFYTPTFSKYAGELCRGIQMHITDHSRFDGFSVGFTLLNTIRALHPNDFRFPGEEIHFIDLLAGNDRLRSGTYSPEQDSEKLGQFISNTEKYRIYR